MKIDFTALFCPIDDFRQSFEPRYHQRLLADGIKRRRRRAGISTAELQSLHPEDAWNTPPVDGLHALSQGRGHGNLLCGQHLHPRQHEEQAHEHERQVDAAEEKPNRNCQRSAQEHQSDRTFKAPQPNKLRYQPPCRSRCLLLTTNKTINHATTSSLNLIRLSKTQVKRLCSTRIFFTACVSLKCIKHRRCCFGNYVNRNLA